MTEATTTHGVALVLGLAMIGAGLVGICCGDVDEAYASAATPQLALAATCAGETSWTNLDECTAIGIVLERRSSTGAVTPAIARAYSAAYRSARRRWVLELAPTGERPPSFPPHLSWSVWGPRWGALFDHAGTVVRGEADSPCEEDPDHFGARYGIDAERPRLAGWIPVDCGRTRNAFWRVPR